MSPQELQNKVEALRKEIAILGQYSIGPKIDPQTSVYLTKFVNDINNLLPTQTYSTSTPSGAAVAGSLWMRDTGTLATNTIHVYSGSAWVQIK